MKKVFFTALPERAILEKPFRRFMQIAVRAGELGYTYIDCPKMRVDSARDAVVKKFLEVSSNPDDTLIMLDADHKNYVNVLEKLVSDDKPVVSALAVRSNPEEPLPCFWLRDENGQLYIPRSWEKGLVQVAVTGSGAIAIKRSTFIQLIESGFDRMFFFYTYEEDGTRVSDEVPFSQMCEQVGIPVFVDTDICAPHMVDAELDESSYLEWLDDNPEPQQKEYKLSVIIPQRGRFDQLVKAVNSLIATAPDAQCIIVYDQDEFDKMFTLAVENNWVHPKVVLLQHTSRAIEKWNYAAKVSGGDVLMVAANDVEFKPGWWEQARKSLDTLPNGGMVSVYDGFTDPKVSSPHFLMTREYMEKENGGVLMPPVYEFQFADVDNRMRAKAKNKYAVSMGEVTHVHPLTSDTPVDEIHQQGYLKSFDKDKAKCKEQGEKGYPVEW